MLIEVLITYGTLVKIAASFIMKKFIIYSLTALALVFGVFIKFFTIGAGDVTKFEVTSSAQWPQMSGTTLLGEDFILPDQFESDLNLVVIGFKRRHQEDINTWIDAYANSDLKEKNIGFYEVPVVYEMEFSQRFFLNNAMKFGVPDEDQKRRTVTVFLDRSKFLKTMNMDEDLIYALLVQKDGTILWMTNGVVSEQSMNGLKEAIAQNQPQIEK